MNSNPYYCKKKLKKTLSTDQNILGESLVKWIHSNKDKYGIHLEEKVLKEDEENKEEIKTIEQLEEKLKNLSYRVNYNDTNKKIEIVYRTNKKITIPLGIGGNEEKINNQLKN